MCLGPAASTSGFDSFTSEAPSQVSADDASAAAAAAAGAAAAAEAAAAEAEIVGLSLDAAASIEKVLSDKPLNPRLGDVVKVCLLLPL